MCLGMRGSPRRHVPGPAACGGGAQQALRALCAMLPPQAPPPCHAQRACAAPLRPARSTQHAAPHAERQTMQACGTKGLQTPPPNNCSLVHGCKLDAPQTHEGIGHTTRMMGRRRVALHAARNALHAACCILHASDTHPQGLASHHQPLHARMQAVLPQRRLLARTRQRAGALCAQEVQVVQLRPAGRGPAHACVRDQAGPGLGWGSGVMARQHGNAVERAARIGPCALQHSHAPMHARSSQRQSNARLGSCARCIAVMWRRRCGGLQARQQSTMSRVLRTHAHLACSTAAC